MASGGSVSGRPTPKAFARAPVLNQLQSREVCQEHFGLAPVNRDIFGLPLEGTLRLNSPLALVLTAAMLLPPSIFPQQSALKPASPPAQPTTDGLKIVIIKGANSTNSIFRKFAEQPVVEIRDVDDKPVAGAEVIFQVPWTGPGAAFDDWLRALVVQTGPDGRAATRGMAPNNEEGQFNIKVMANYQGKSAVAVIPQTNVLGKRGQNATSNSHKTLWITLAVLGAGAIAGGAAAASRGGGSTPATASNPVVISSGGITVAGPR